MFSSVNEVPLPEGALLQEFVDSGEYTDCFATTLDFEVEFQEFIEAFYTTMLFKAERLILKLVKRPSTDEEAVQLSREERGSFAAWNLHARSDNQLVMMDFRGQTCSWFMLSECKQGSLLYFGSAVMRNKETATGRTMHWPYRVLLGLHRLYSRALLQAARSRLIR